MAEYKLVKIHLFNNRTTNCMYASWFLDKWVERICQCDNMTLTRKSAVGNFTYYAVLNDGKLGLIFNSSYVPYFGTRASNSADNALSGLQVYFGDFTADYNAGEGTLEGSRSFYPFEMDCSLIIDDDNNLVYASSLCSKGTVNMDYYGFLFTNEGIMNTSNNQIYSMGASPAVIKYTEAYNSPTEFIKNFVPATDDQEVNTVMMSDDIVRDTSNFIEVRDHVKWIYSDKLARPQNSGFQEIVTIDDNMYMHIGTGYTWIPIKEIEYESIEVNAA